MSSGSSVFLFIGRESGLKEKAIGDLGLAALDKSMKDLDYKVFYGSDASAREILDYARTFPCLAPKRFIVIKDFGTLPEDDRSRLISYIEKPSKYACIIFDLDDDSMLKEYPSAERFAKVMRFGQLTGPALRLWIQKYLSSNYKRIKPDAIDVLIEMTGDDRFVMAPELDKLISFVGDRQDITAADIKDIAGMGAASSAFDIVRAIGENDTAGALKIARDLVLAGKKVHEIIGLIAWHFRRLFKARLLKERGETNFYIANAVGLKRGEASRFFKQLERFDTSRIKSKMDILLETDMDLKRSRLDPALLVEFAIIRLSFSS